MLEDKFMVGVNYWASHAGTAMWTDWQPAIVEKDFKRIAEYGITVLRVFPLWSDFQPIKMLKACQNMDREIRMGENPLPYTEAGRNGIDEVMVNRFDELLNMAKKENMKVSVSLINGWMSGRMFVPPALEGKDLLTDSFAVMWETRFIKYMVKRFIDNEAIIAWCAGNETDCLQEAGKYEKWCWSAHMADAIKSIDITRPVMDDMHGFKSSCGEGVAMRADIADVKTVHSYPWFSRHCMEGAADSVKNLLSSTAEGAVYADLSGKPCITEEIGTLGDFFCSKNVSANYAKTNILSNWANGLSGFMWWCAHEQSHLTMPPYDWNACERELGIFDVNGDPKPIAYVMRDFSKAMERLPFQKLPKAQKDAVCILSKGQDNWANALSAYILAKQAGFDITFATPQNIPKSSLYFLPGVCGNAISLRSWETVLSEVREGAALYISYGNALLANFEKITGLELMYNTKRRDPKVVTEGVEFECERKLTLRPTRAVVLLREDDGNPLYSVADYGKGKVYFLSVPLEYSLAKNQDNFDGGHYKIYNSLLRHTQRTISKNDPNIGITEHPVDNGKIIVALNYSKKDIEFDMKVNGRFTLGAVYMGEVNINESGLNAKVGSHSGVIFMLEENK